MSDIPHFKKFGGDEHSVLDVVFIHGLTGDPFETWTTENGDEFWPNWLLSDFENVAVYALGYPSSLFEKWAKKEMDIHERANYLIELLVSNGLGERPIAFVTHSLGGLMAKEVLRASNEAQDEDWKSISQSARMCVFYATPHQGASLAAALRIIAPRISSKFVDELSASNGYLKSLNLAYRDLVAANDVSTVSYYEKYKTKGMAVVVNSDSADPGTGKTRPIAIDADHISICKPRSTNDTIYRSLCRHIRNLLKKLPSTASGPSGEDGAFDSENYGEKSTSDRRDLLKKLIDAGREYEYRYANDLQNKFTQDYYKNGLYTEAKERDDAILSEVHQRFLTHVYSKICNGASDDEIADALQKRVIDPLCSSSAPKMKLNPTGVLKALYFLTEQCHIQWDAP